MGHEPVWVEAYRGKRIRRLYNGRVQRVRAELRKRGDLHAPAFSLTLN